jgi:hypothetical protein
MRAFYEIGCRRKGPGTIQISGPALWRTIQAAMINGPRRGPARPRAERVRGELAAPLVPGDPRAQAPAREGFMMWVEMLAMVPGYPGIYRAARYYWWTLGRCSLRVFIGLAHIFRTALPRRKTTCTGFMHKSAAPLTCGAGR